MSQEELPCAIIYKGEPLPKKHKSTIFDWISYYVYNLVRKPFVWKKQKELGDIFDKIVFGVNTEVLPSLLKNINTCQQCREAYVILRNQVFVSQIESILNRMQCTKHKEIFTLFLNKNSHKFIQSDELSRWINGFTK